MQTLRTPPTLLAAASALLLILGPGLAVAGPQDETASPIEAGAPGPRAELAAWADEDAVTFEELDHLLVERLGGSERGREAALYLIQRRLIAHLAAEAGLEVGEDELLSRWRELDRDLREAGYPEGLAGELERGGISRAEFRETLRLALLHEELARRGLGIGPGQPVSGDAQELWLEGRIEELGLEFLPWPYEEGLAARCGPVTVSVRALGEALRERQSASELRDAASQLLLLRRVGQRLADLDTEAREALVAAEVARRRAEAEADPRYQGVPFESLLAAQGLTEERLARDPAVRIAALSTHWVEREYGGERLRAAFEAERDFFERHFGAAVRVRALFLTASREATPLVPRTFEEAERTVLALMADVNDELDFAVVARRHSEDAESREGGGHLGFLVRASRTLPEPLLEELFALEWPEEGGSPGILLAPRRVSNGVVALWAAERRATPQWEELSKSVSRELRRRFLVETLPPDSVRTYLDPAPAPSAPAQED